MLLVAVDTKKVRTGVTEELCFGPRPSQQYMHMILARLRKRVDRNQSAGAKHREIGLDFGQPHSRFEVG